MEVDQKGRNELSLIKARRKLLSSGSDLKTRFSSDHCLKCNICTAACPVMAVSGVFRGPKAVGPQAQRFRHPRLPIPDDSVSWCSGCGTCTSVCPHGVLVAEINIQAKARLIEQGHAPLRDQLLARPEMLGKLARPAAGLTNKLLELPISRWLMEKGIGIASRAPLPAFSGETLRTRRADLCVDQPPRNAGTKGDTIAYFHGCSTNYYEPELGLLTIAVLEKLGIQVLIPPQNCCGLPLQSNGLFSAARRYARANAEKMAPFVQAGLPIVGTSTSCTLAFKHEYRAVLGLEGAKFEMLADRTRDLFEFLLWDAPDRLEKIKLGPLSMKVLYHIPCQLRSHAIGAPALQLLHRIPGLEIELSQAACCGVAGTYGVKAERYDVARAVGEPLFQQAIDSGAELVVTDSETCRWWIGEHTGLPSVHPVELLARSLGIAAQPDRIGPGLIRG
jgi:glycerol-3-phosphate dehydrogenase subunit C